MPRNAEVIRQWQILREIEARRIGVTIHELASLVKVTTRTIRRDLQALEEAGLAEVGGVRINISGCTNSCGQHHISDIGFFGLERPRATAPARATLQLRDAGERIEVTDVEATLGGLTVTGDVRITTSGAKPVIDARLQSERLDWAQALVESGDTPVAPLPPDQVLYDRPIAWPLLVAMKGKQGTIEARLGSLRVRNGIELRQVKADMTFDEDILDVKTFTANLLGGSAKAAMRFEGSKKAVRVNVEGNHLLLERWFRERGSDAPFTGGPMTISAKLAATGESMRALSKAYSLTTFNAKVVASLFGICHKSASI